MTNERPIEAPSMCSKEKHIVLVRKTNNNSNNGINHDDDDDDCNKMINNHIKHIVVVGIAMVPLESTVDQRTRTKFTVLAAGDFGLILEGAMYISMWLELVTRPRRRPSRTRATTLTFKSASM